MRRAVATAPAQLGLGSVLLLAACVRWAHHWVQPRTDALVAAWAAAALAVAGAVWAAGCDVAGACGGG